MHKERKSEREREREERGIVVIVFGKTEIDKRESDKESEKHTLYMWRL
jgi:hypothetical protein